MSLARFHDAQRDVYAQALAELRAGRKTSHWMWFVFPQIAGLGHSATARHYAIADIAEAKAYVADSVLGARLIESAQALLDHRGQPAEVILGPVDAQKLRSSMTLFEAAAENPAPFAAILEAFFGGSRDAFTLERLR